MQAGAQTLWPRAYQPHGTGADLTTVTYDDATGNRTVTNALGQQSVYKFAVLQSIPKLVEIDRLATATTAAATRTFSYDGNGYLSGTTDWNSILTTYSNDAAGNVLSMTEASGTAQARTTSYSYVGNNPLTDFHLPSQIAVPGKTTNLSYDANGYLLTRTETDTGSGQTRSWSYTNDALGHVLTATDPNGNTTTFTYAGDNIATITNALGQVTRVPASTPDSLPTTIVDPNGVTTTLAYDGRQRLLSSTIATAAGNRATKFAYDLAGNLVRYAHDAAGRVIPGQQLRPGAPAGAHDRRVGRGDRLHARWARRPEGDDHSGWRRSRGLAEPGGV